MKDLSRIKRDFPVFKYYPDLVYLDSTASSLKPRVVIDKIIEYYQQYPANVFRGFYKISDRATQEFEESRQKIAGFINARVPEEIIFTRNTTESLNLIAHSLGPKIVGRKDAIITSVMEHHSNFVPWQILASRSGAHLKIMDVDDEGYLKLSELDRINKKTKILAIAYTSNVLGTVNPIKEIVKRARALNPKIVVVVDAAQTVPHLKINVRDLGCDFLAFSGYKMLGPTGVGILWGKKEILENLPPFNFGGNMVERVSLKKSVFKGPPWRFEAGTPHIAGVIALKEAVAYLRDIGMSEIQKHEMELTAQTLQRLQEEFGKNIKILGPKTMKSRSGVLAFNLRNFHPHDVAQILDQENICVRAGHHCTMPLHKRLGARGSVRASFYIYNDERDVAKLIGGLKKAEKILGD